MGEQKLCSHCNQPIEDEENVILCASCQKPHHKECWTKCKCFINCNGDDDNDEIQNYNFVNQYTDFEQDNSLSHTDLSVELQYVGFKKLDYYRHAFIQITDYSTSNFNFAAFFFNAIWLFYRKLYKESILVMIISLAAQILAIGGIEFLYGLMVNLTDTRDELYNLANIMSGLQDAIPYIVFFIISICIGFMANKLYFKKITKLKNSNKDYSCGGTNILAIIIVPIIAGILEIVANTLMRIFF